MNAIAVPLPRAAPPAAEGLGPRPEISVVVPTYHRPETLLRLLLCLARQTLDAARFEIIVVDDGRDDTTRELVESIAAQRPAPSLRYLRPQHGRGPAAARNRGWRAASGAIVAFTDDDTLPAPEWLERGVEAMAVRPVAALGGRVVVPPADRGASPTDHERVTRGLERTEFVTANAFVRWTALAEVGGFDERYTRAWREDSDLQFRLEAQVGPVARCEQAVVLHPVRRERWGVSLRQQRNALFEALIYRQHPHQYRRRLAPAPPWHYYVIVGCTLAAPWLWMAGIPSSAAAAAAIALAGVLRFALQRLRGTSHAPAHIAEMLLTSLAIPFLAVYWRLRGALRYRVWFL